MKKVLSVLLITLLASAGNATLVDEKGFAAAIKCSKSLCHTNAFGTPDNGVRFKEYCEATWPNIPNYYSMQGPRTENGQLCYCPCTLEFLSN